MNALLSVIAVAMAAQAAPPVEVGHVGLGSSLEALVAGPDGGAWVGVSRFVEGLDRGQDSSDDAIARATPDGRFQLTAIEGALSLADGALGPDGQAWYQGGLSLHRSDAAGGVTRLEVEQPLGDVMATGPDGTLWSAEGRRPHALAGRRPGRDHPFAARAARVQAARAVRGHEGRDRRGDLDRGRRLRQADPDRAGQSARRWSRWTETSGRSRWRRTGRAACGSAAAATGRRSATPTPAGRSAAGTHRSATARPPASRSGRTARPTSPSGVAGSGGSPPDGKLSRVRRRADPGASGSPFDPAGGAVARQRGAARPRPDAEPDARRVRRHAARDQALPGRAGLRPPRRPAPRRPDHRA